MTSASLPRFLRGLVCRLGHSFLIASVLALPASTAVAGPDSERPSASTISVLVVDGLRNAELAAALGVRLPSVSVFFQGEAIPSAPASGRAFLIVQAEGRRRGFELILTDGRTYRRALDAEGAAFERAVAGSLANLIAGVEAGTTVPDEVVEELPPALGPPVRAEDPPDVSDWVRAPESDSVGRGRTGKVDSRDTAEVSGTSTSSPRTPDPGRPDRALDIYGHGSGVLGLAPSGGLPALATGLGLEFVADSGLVTGGEFRFVRAQSEGLEVRRFGASSHLGYRFGAASFELSSLAFATIEPWFVRSGGKSLEVYSTTSEARALVGGGLRTIPSFRFETRSTVDVLLGVPLSLQYSAVVGSAQAVTIEVEGGEKRVNTGGLELGFGLLLRVRLRRRSQPKPPM